ncbi:MAG: hypothetical protein PVF37_06865, partial [Desulfobacterales bacterium]
MPSRLILMISCALALLSSACFLKPQFSTLEAQLEDSRNRKDQVKSRLAFLEKKLAESEKELDLATAELHDTRVA